ncbi:MAG: hemolysin family protein [Ignavibacteriaceae bacterium]|nr:hemolysin family protein [Ignavibacteriaceae bacterium]
MNIDWLYKVGFLLILFVLSAFFSGSEVALFSLDKKKLQNTYESNPLIRRYLENLLDFPRRLLVTILLGNTIINVAASIIAVSIAIDYSRITGFPRGAALTVEIILLTIFILIIGELIPKIWAAKNPVGFAKFISVPLYWLNVILFPLAEILTETIRSLISFLKIDKTKSAILKEEISELANLGHERGTIVEEEHGLINSIVNFRNVEVHEVMTPRVDIVAVSADTTFDEMLGIITKSGYSRIPLYHNDLDDIIGIVYTKDLLPFIKSEDKKKNFSLTGIARKAMFIPGTKLISSLMHEFQEKKMHVAIVVDEYGGTAGLISLEDIIEEILGEMRDEYDQEEIPVTKVDDNNYIVLGKLPVDDLNELLNTTFDENSNYETVAGMILNHVGQIPKEGYSFKIDGYRFIVKEVQNKRIKKVQVEKLSVI